MFDHTDISFFVRLLDRSRPDVEVARQGLETAVSAMQDKINALNASLTHLQVQRRQLLERKVSKLLPDFSAATLHTLKQECPGFVDTLVLATFKENRKIWGLFARPGSSSALATLQIRLAFYLDGQRSADIGKIDAQITSVSQEKEEWERARFARVNFMAVLERAQATGDVSGEMQENIRQLAEQTRQLAAEKVNATTRQAEATVNETANGAANGMANGTTAQIAHASPAYDQAAWIYLGNKKYFENRQAQDSRYTTYNNSSNPVNEHHRMQNEHWQEGQPFYANTVLAPQFDSSDMFHNPASGYVPAGQTMPTESVLAAQIGGDKGTLQRAGMADLYDCNSHVIVGSDIRTDDSLGAYS